MQCLLSTIYRSHHLPIECRNRENDSRCCLCICLISLPECLWEGDGGRGLHWVNPTSVREPLLLSPLSITWSLFLLSWCASQGCAYEPMPLGIWHLKYQEYGFCTWNFSVWYSLFSLSCIAPCGLTNISPLLPYATLSISASNQGEVYRVILQRKQLKWCKRTCGIYMQRYLDLLPHLL